MEGRSIVNIEDEEKEDDGNFVVWTQRSSASQRGRGSGVCGFIYLSFMNRAGIGWGIGARFI